MVGLGSNRCHGRHGRPEAVVRAAADALAAAGVRELRLSPVIRTAPVGPSSRRFANAAAAGIWEGDAIALLGLLKAMERDFGRRPGRRWGERVLDCDLLAFGGGTIRADGLEVPHPRLQMRDFVLRPMQALWPQWRHPRSGLTVRQMRARLRRPRPVD
ncbi:MAG: 2-amino-4-hydroxy-6-hydroxymethyldihydropteridine diphosphokinase [Sandaracinobacteroides sp.]